MAASTDQPRGPHPDGHAEPNPAAHAAPLTEVTLTNSRPDIEQAERAVLDALALQGYPEASRFAVRLALEEALVNAFMHGHRGLPASTPVTLRYHVGPQRLTIQVEDRGSGFAPGAVPDPTREENLELPSGRGLMLIRSFMSAVHHELDGRRLVMWYTRPT